MKSRNFLDIFVQFQLQFKLENKNRTQEIQIKSLIHFNEMRKQKFRHDYWLIRNYSVALLTALFPI